MMPPWHADPKHGKFANDRSLTAPRERLLTRWANGGAPEGDPKDLPPAPKFVEGWQLGEPDAVLQMPVEYKVPADGFVEYEYFEIPTNFTEDKWLRGARGPARQPRGRAPRDRVDPSAAAGAPADRFPRRARHGRSRRGSRAAARSLKEPQASARAEPVPGAASASAR